MGFIKRRFTFKGAVAHMETFFRSFPKKFEFVSLCSFICLQAVYQLSGPARLLGVAALRILLLTITSCFVIDSLCRGLDPQTDL